MTVPTWRVEGVLSTPAVGVRVFVEEDGMEVTELCDVQENAEGFTTGFTCVASDSTLFPILSVGSGGLGMDGFLVTALVNLPPMGLPSDSLSIDWTLTGEDDAGRMLSPATASASLEGATIADAAVVFTRDTSDDGVQRRELRFDMLTDIADVPVEITADSTLFGFDDCRAEGDELICRTVVSAGAPITAELRSDASFVRVAVVADGFPVDPDLSNNELTFDPPPISSPESGGCVVVSSPFAAGWWLVLVACAVRRRA